MAFGKQTHKGKYRVKNPSKYIGDIDDVVYRSSWERAAFLWCDRQPHVKQWNSEGIVIPYRSSVDGKPHRYFVDLYLEMADGRKWIIEIKPSKETRPPRKSANRQRYMTESLTYIKNQNKWDAARQFAKKQGWTFMIWDEHFLKSSGILKF
jgi:hypothetical protein